MEIDDVDWSTEYDGETFEVVTKGETIVGCHWRVKEGPTKYVIIYMHGLCSAVCFNANVMRVFAEHGGAAIAADHRGHGRSPGARTQTTVPQVIEGIEQQIAYASSQYPDIPIYLFGHSFGGLATLCFMTSKSEFINKVKGVIVTGPWLRAYAYPNPSFLLRMGLKVGSWVLPFVGIPTGLDVSKSPYPDGYKKAVMESPHMQVKASPVILNSFVQHMDYIQQSAHLYPPEVPLLFLQGTSDKLVHPPTNKEWAQSIPNCEFIEYEGGPHDLMKSKFRGEIYRKIFHFIGIE